MLGDVQKKVVNLHALRYTYTTHQLNNGTEIRYIQALLGHANIKTTLRYTHIAQKTIAKFQRPIDRLNL